MPRITRIFAGSAERDALDLFAPISEIRGDFRLIPSPQPPRNVNQTFFPRDQESARENFFCGDARAIAAIFRGDFARHSRAKKMSPRIC